MLENGLLTLGYLRYGHWSSLQRMMYTQEVSDLCRGENFGRVGEIRWQGPAWFRWVLLLIAHQCLLNRWSGDEGSLFLGYLDAFLPRTGAMNEATVRCLTKSYKNRFAMQTSLETSSAIMFSRWFWSSLLVWAAFFLVLVWACTCTFSARSSLETSYCFLTILIVALQTRWLQGFWEEQARLGNTNDKYPMVQWFRDL